MSDILLVINAGSSSIKFQLFAVQPEDRPKRLLRGQFDGIGVRPRLVASGTGIAPVDHVVAPEQAGDVAAAFRVVDRWLGDVLGGTPPVAIGHRVVHGGSDFSAPVLVDDRILDRLQALIPLAPLHQPNNLAPIREARRRYPAIPQVVCFDTAFHRGHPEVVDRFALPDPLYRAGIRRYGFHGLSYEYVAQRLREVAPDIAAGRVLILHLGSGASICALKDGHSVDSTMSFTALDGLAMGTRPGQLDSGVVLHLVRAGWSGDEIERLLYKESGLQALSGTSSDMRELEASNDPRARFAIEYFVHRVGKEIGGLAAVLGGVDGLVFTAGIGENSALIRSLVCRHAAWLGVLLDDTANAKGDSCISQPGSRVQVYVVPTDEELMIARHCFSLMRSSG